MLKGLLFAALACLLWGTHYVIPNFAPGFSTPEIIFGRYLVFGVFSLSLALFSKGATGFDMKTLPSFKVILTLAFLGFFIYDILEISNVRSNGSEAVALIYGLVLLMSPLVIRIFTQKCLPSRNDWVNLIFPLAGLIVLEWEILDSVFDAGWPLCWGLAIFQAALSVLYTREMAISTRSSSEPEKTASSITIMIGLTCLVLSVCGWSYYILMVDMPPLSYFREHSSSDWMMFLGSSLLSGIGINWLATHLWCVASIRVPYTLLSCMLLGDVVAAKIYELFLCENSISPFHIIGTLMLLGSGALIRFFGADYEEDPNLANIQAVDHEPSAEKSPHPLLEAPVPAYEM